jgi:2-succinyl-5-enolpyruvyl-6-hydroxy-3-cyclohexene-1-carboxylate synthase
VSEGDVALACASVFVGQLERDGLTDACISPGSRSTPIALALARAEGIRVHVHLDERSSAFFALGLAKASGRPVVVACTSGTAAANLFPAVVEASMSPAPLILLTADRPPELRGVGANQTIDQRELFGPYPRWFSDAPPPSEDADATRTWVLLAAEAHRQACRPGPVHVNLPYREPLVPAGESVRLGDVATAFAGASPGEGKSVGEDDVDGFVELVAGMERGLVYVGGLRSPSPYILDLAARLGWPVIAEPTSGLRVPGSLSAAQFLLSDEPFLDAHLPDVVVQFGAAPTSRAALGLVGSAPRLVIVDPDDLVADPHARAERRFAVHAGQFAYHAIPRFPGTPRAAWLTEWVEADERARTAVDATVDAWGEPYEGRIARDVAASVPHGGVLVVGSSMPVRDLDAYMRPREGLRVLANRGASGIDGFVSTALGVSAAGAPTTALCGDLTLLHDIGSLIWSASRNFECVLVVPNNDGGAIFSFLPQRGLPEFEELFAMPHGRDIVEVPIDRARNVELHAAVQEAVAAALGRTM